jgi:hypothetical protein
MDVLIDFIVDIANRIANVGPNIWNSVNNVDLKNWVRIIAIVGAYLLLRPHLVKYGARKQEQELEKVDKEPLAGPKAKISPNALRDTSGKAIELEDSESEVEDGAPQWGKKARVRQRTVVKKIQEAMEQKSREDDEGNKSILDQFVDYEEGKDGW